MTKTLKGGHRVLFADDERLDIPDTIALPELVYDYLNEVSSLLGGGSSTNLDGGLPVGGTLTELRFDTTTPANTTIYGPGGTATDKAVFSLSYEVQLGEFEHHILTYDPAASGQQTEINLSIYGDGDTPFIWARRVDINQDVDTRRKWDTVGGSEILFSLATREGYRIQFETTTGTTPPAGDRWCPIAQVALISGGGTVFQFALIHPFDLGTVPTSGSYYWGSLLPSITGTAYRYLGVPAALYQLKALYDQEAAQRLAADSILDAAIVVNAGDIAANQAGILVVADNVSNLGFSNLHGLRVQANGAGSWSIADEQTSTAGATVTTVDAWTFRVTYTFVTRHIQLTPGRSLSLGATVPSDAVVGYQPNGNYSPAGAQIEVFVRTRADLVAAAYDWSVVPGGSPSNDIVIDVLAGA